MPSTEVRSIYSPTEVENITTELRNSCGAVASAMKQNQNPTAELTKLKTNIESILENYRHHGRDQDFNQQER